MPDIFPGADEGWAAFLDNSISGLTKAGERLRENIGNYETKSDWFRPKNKEIPRENSVSRALADIFNKIRSEQVIQGDSDLIDLRHIIAECEIPRPLDRGMADEAKPTDFRLTMVYDGQLDLRIEAKTVLTEREIRDSYLGTEGLRRFEDAVNPYTIAPYGGMVAYVVDQDKIKWGQRISKELKGKYSAKSTEMCQDVHYVSSHVFDSDKSVDVLHFVIEIDAMPSRRSTSALPESNSAGYEDKEAGSDAATNLPG